jgi:hypothetical protein
MSFIMEWRAEHAARMGGNYIEIPKERNYLEIWGNVAG